MPGESQQVPGSAPDPSVFTTEAIVRAARAERDYVDGQIGILQQRLDGMDKAAEVLHETVTRTPTEIQKVVGHLRELACEWVTSLRREMELLHDASETAIAKQEKANDERLGDLRRAIDALEEKVGRLV